MRKPQVYGVARKMDRTALKSDYCMIIATKAFGEFIEKAYTKYILRLYINYYEDKLCDILKEKNR